MKTIVMILISLTLGVWFGSLITSTPAHDHSDKRKPLYWVAPMDDNYRRDEPGLSPMGMALVPVYAEDQQGPDEGPGTVFIRPEVENQLAVKTSEISYGTIDQNHTTQGVLRFASEKTHHVHAQTNGWIRDLLVHSPGDHVTEGQLLYRLYATDWVNAQQELLFALKQHDATLEVAATQRLKALLFPEQAIQTVKSKQVVLESVPFYAPHSGFITKLNVQNGHQVNSNDTLMVIVDTDVMWLDAEWTAPQGLDLTPGRSVQAITSHHPNRTWRGRIDHINPSADNRNRSLVTRITLDNRDHLLKANMDMTVTLENHAKQPVLLVPNSALILIENQSRVVLSLGQGAYKTVAVQLGQRGQQFSQVTQGLKAGDEVVTSAQFLIDSESSKTSDFKRMGDAQWPHALAYGTVLAADPMERRMRIHRSAITKWQRGPATVDFWVEDVIDMSDIKKGDLLSFKFEIRDGHFYITHIERPQHD